MSEEQIQIGIVDQDFARVEKKLANGWGGDPHVHGEALLLITRVLRPLLARSTVTESECTQRRKDCPGQAQSVGATITKAIGFASPALVAICYIIAKKEGWL